jgi:DNA-binding transcriptional ArsR family regulator
MLQPLSAIKGGTVTATTKRGKRLKGALASAVAHPVRSRALTWMAERATSPAQIARELGVDTSSVNYHVQVLVEENLIELVGSRPVRGAIEHFYRAVELPFVSNEQEAERSSEDRRAFAETTVAIYAANVADAIDRGTMLKRSDHYLVRHALSVDEEGWTELSEAFGALMETVFDIKQTAAERMEGSSEKPIRVVAFENLFEVPPN